MISLNAALWPTGRPSVFDAASLGLVEVQRSVDRWVRRSGSLMENWPLLLIVLAIASLWIVLYLWERFHNPRRSTLLDHEGLFEQLCNLHRLPRSDRLLIKTVARRQNLNPPALVFVDPRGLLEYADASPDDQDAVRSLADRLFGESLIHDIVLHEGQASVDGKPQ